MNERILSTVFVLILTPILLFADMGAIVPLGNASIAEPSQKALILHNGKEEVLILGTDIQSSPAGPMVRFIPLPSKPSVSLAKKDIFEKLNGLIKKSGLQYVYQTKGPAELKPAAELVLHKKIGAHDITVIRLKSSADFLTWVRNFLKQKKLPSAGLDYKIEFMASDYIKRGFPYFVFDVIEPDSNAQSVDPIVYRFPSSRIYYPLKTSNLFGGKGSIDLIVAAPTAREIYGLSTHHYMVSTTANIEPADLKAFYPDSMRFFKSLKGRKPVLQAIRFDGELKFDDDIWIDAMKGVKELKPSGEF